MENLILYDWLSFTTQIHSPQGIIEELGFKDVTFNLSYGFYGYKQSFYYEGVRIHFDGHREEMGVHVEMSGKGCRTFETNGHGNYEYIFEEILQNPKDMTLKRLDIACDDHEKKLDIREIENDTRNHNYISRFRAYEFYDKFENGMNGLSVLLGSKSSEVYIRIYDKSAERGFDPQERHWIRTELVLKNDRALEFVKLDLPIGEAFYGVVNNYLRFVEPNKNDTHKERWKTRAYWQKFIDSTRKISVYKKPGVEYNLENLENYVFNQAGNAIDTFIEIFGVEKFIKSLKERKTLQNPKYEELKEKHAYKMKDGETLDGVLGYDSNHWAQRYYDDYLPKWKKENGLPT